MYSEKVMDHFKNPRNQGVMKDPSGVGVVGNPVCGDKMDIYIKVENDVVADISFQTYGCVAAVATSSMVTELARGKKVEEAARISKKDVADALEGLPAQKLHCSNLAADGVKAALLDWMKKDGEAKGRFPEIFKQLEEEVRLIREKEKKELEETQGESCST